MAQILETVEYSKNARPAAPFRLREAREQAMMGRIDRAGVDDRSAETSGEDQRRRQ